MKTISSVIAATALMVSVAGVSTSAQAGAPTIAVNTWYTGQFGSAGSPLTGGDIFGVGVTPPFGTATVAPTSAWTVDLTSPGELIVTDLEASGDQFTLYNNGVLLGTTSVPTDGTYVGYDISSVLSNPVFSHGTFALPTGLDTITGNLTDLTVGEGDFAFAVTGVPEPATWAMTIAGMGLMGAMLRRRRHAAPVAAV